MTELDYVANMVLDLTRRAIDAASANNYEEALRLVKMAQDKWAKIMSEGVN